MQRIYEPASLLEAQMLLGMLENEGVGAHLAGRDLVGGMGDLPAMGLLGLLVADEQADYARQLIGEYNSALPMSGDEPDSFPGVLLC